MIVSHKYKFCFVAVPRTGTTSLQRTLLDHMGPNDQHSMRGARLVDNHASYQDIVSRWPVVRRYFSFAIIRNPWDLAASYYSHWWKTLYTYETPLSMDLWLDDPEVLRVLKTSHLYTHNGVVQVDRLCRFENFNHDLQEVMNRLGLPIDISAMECWNTQRERRDYAYLFNKSAQRKIERHMSLEIELGKYRFSNQY